MAIMATDMCSSAPKKIIFYKLHSVKLIDFFLKKIQIGRFVKHEKVAKMQKLWHQKCG